MKKLTEKQKRECKFLLMLPVLTLPFLCVAFWAMGGGKQVNEFEQRNGLNLLLPEARIESGSMNKMESYELAERKATLMAGQLRMDPFANSSGNEMVNDTLLPFPVGVSRSNTLEQTDNAVKEKLSELQDLIEQPVSEAGSEVVESRVFVKDKNSDREFVDPDLKKLESMMAAVMEPGREDPEMEQIDNLLDKLLDVQHPQRVQERLSQVKKLERESAYKVSLNPIQGTNDELIEIGVISSEVNGFYTLEKVEKPTFSAIQPAISAAVTRDQEVVTGASIEIELSQPVFIEGVEFPKGTRVTGVCDLKGERLNITIKAIRADNLIVPVSLEAIDLDALPGIKIPGSIARDAIKDGAGEGIESLNMMGMSPSWEAQASMVGMETVKGVLSKKAKLIKVTVKAGHPLLLADLSGS